MDLRNLRIGARLGVGFGLILMILVAVLMIGNVSSARSGASLIDRLQAANAKSELAATMKSAVLQQGIAMRNIGLQHDVASMRKEEAKVKEENKRFSAARDQLVALGMSSAEKKMLEEIARLDKELETPLNEAIEQLQTFNGEQEAAKIIVERIGPLNQRAVVEIDKLVRPSRRLSGKRWRGASVLKEI